jgi:hypothetical protein
MPCITIKSLQQWTCQITPYIEERQLNILIRRFLRLMMDRIIFLEQESTIKL